MDEKKMGTQGLSALDPIDAFKLAAEQSHKSLKEIADAMGWGESHARRVFSTEKYFPSIADIPKFCNVVGNHTIILWQQAKAMTYGMPESCRDIDCEKLVFRIGALFAEVGDVGRKGQEAVADGKLEAHELRAIINEVKDVLTEGMELVGDLRVLEREIAKSQGGEA